MMSTQINEPARRRIKRAVPAQTEFLVERAGGDAQQQQPKNPNERVDEQLPSPLPIISAEIGCFSCAGGYATFLLPENPSRHNRRWSAPSGNSPLGTCPAIRLELREFR